MMKAKAFNPQVFLECLCCLVFAGSMLYLVGSEKYLAYVTPRMAPYLCFSAAVMGLWAVVGLRRMLRPQHRVRSMHCLVLAVPVLFLLLPHAALGSSDISGRYLGGGALSGNSGRSLSSEADRTLSSTGYATLHNPFADSGDGSGTESGAVTAALDEEYGGELSAAAPPDSAGAAETPSVPAQSGPPAGTDTAEEGTEAGPLYDLPGLDRQNRRITIANDEFARWISELYINMRLYEGYTVVVTGFVFKDPETLKADEFVPARLAMACCAADLVPMGLLCKYDRTSGLEKDSWVTVEGTLFIGTYEFGGSSMDDPQIRVTKISPAQPVEGYVYPI